MAKATHKLSARYGGLTGTVSEQGETRTTFHPDDGRQPIIVESDDVKPISEKPAKSAGKK